MSRANFVIMVVRYTTNTVIVMARTITKLITLADTVAENQFTDNC